MDYQLLDQWIKEIVSLCEPQSVHYCDGSLEEYDALCQKMVKSGTLIPLNPKLRPHSFLCRSDPQDVAGWKIEHSFVLLMRKRPARPITGVSLEK